MTNPTPDSYPVERPADGATDPRFNFGLTIAFRDVLIEHGYPETFSGMDLYNLQANLFAFLYGERR